MGRLKPGSLLIRASVRKKLKPPLPAQCRRRRRRRPANSRPVPSTTARTPHLPPRAPPPGRPAELELKTHGVQLAFALTDYKLQDEMLERLILCIGKTTAKPHLDLTKLYVLFSASAAAMVCARCAS